MTRPVSRTLSIPHPETGEIITLRERWIGNYIEVPDAMVLQAKRWRMKYKVGQILGFQSRQARCHRWKVPSRQVQIFKPAEYDKPFYSGFERCKSVWLCPLCAAKVSERRVSEMQYALDFARDQGLWPQLLTLTFPHGLGDRLQSLRSESIIKCIDDDKPRPKRKKFKQSGIVDKMLNAFRTMFQGRPGERFRKSLKIVGFIRAVEITHGANGWHPHLHVLVFSYSDLPLAQQRKIWAERWCNRCLAAGLPLPDFERGCTLKNGSHAADYVGKWGIEQEMAKAHLKSGKAKGSSPWDLLRMASGDKWEGMPDIVYDPHRAAQLWHVYAGSFKGQNQLRWSPGLKNLFCLEDLTDEQIAEKEEETASVLYTLTNEEWSWILSANAEVDVLSIARDCPEAIPSFIASLKEDNFSTDPELIKRFSHIKNSSTWLPF